MICAKCQTTNRDKARFCKECGRSLMATCPRCGSDLPEAANYCDNCGQHLSSPVAGSNTFRPVEPAAQEGKTTPAAARSQLHRYIPEELLAKLQAAKDTGGMVGERRVVTMLFCDVKGSTTAAEQLDPEEWSDIINGAFEHMIAPVYRYEGTVARLMGDGILAFFGAPIAHEDDAVRAVLAGMEIVQGIGVYAGSVRSRYGIDVGVRVGINTGRVVVGAVGSDLRLEYTALGDAINVASRMESSAAPGTIQIAHDTYRLVAPFFEVEDLGDVTVKGKSEPVPAYRVLERKVDAERPHGVAGLESSLVGRDDELAMLQNALDDLRRGRGRILFLIGEAGLGKSRLIREVRSMAKNGDTGPETLQFWMQRPLASYQSGEAYRVLKDQLRLLYGLDDRASPAEVRAVIKEAIATFSSSKQPGPLYEPLARLMGVLDEEEGEAGAVRGELFKRQLFAATLASFREKIGDTPTVMVIDDLHWVDAASIEAGQQLFQLVDSAPVLFLCACRPVRNAASWDLRTEAEKVFPHRYGEIQLSPLNEKHSLAMLDGLLAGIEWPSKLQSLILEKSEGNPYFIEELVRALIDGEFVIHDASQGVWRVAAEVTDFAIPGNLQALLAARVDRLPEEERRILQVAAVIGRSFSYRVLEHICDDTSNLNRSLAALQRAELIVEESTIPVRLFRFRNTLAQDTVYRAILRKTRREWHRRVGEALLAIYSDRLEEQLPALAYHFYRAEDSRALTYNNRAGDAAYRLYANLEAATHYGRAIEIARDDRDVTAEQLTRLFKHRGRALELASKFADALDNYREMEKLAIDRQDKAMELASLVSTGTIYATSNDQYDPGRAQAVSDRALALAEALQDEMAEAKIYWNLLNAHRLSNSYANALSAGERSMTLARKNKLTEQLAYTANDISHVYFAAGESQKAVASINEAIGLWRQLDNQPMLADSLATASYVIGTTDSFESALALSDESYRISQSIGNIWGQSYSRFFIGSIYWNQGLPGKAVETMEECVRLGKEAGFLTAQLYVGPQLALCYAHLGAHERAITLARQFLIQTREQMRTFEPIALAQLGYAYLLAGRNDEAQPVFEDLMAIEISLRTLMELPVAEAKCHYHLAAGHLELAIADARHLVTLVEKVKTTVYQPSAYQTLGEVLLRAGQLDQARFILDKGRLLAEKLDLRWPLWKILAALAGLQHELGHNDEAKLLQLDARLIFNEIAEQIPTAELRDSFLARHNWPAY